MDPQKLIQYFYFINIGVFVSGVYLIVLYILLGDTLESMEQAAHTAIHLAVMLWFRNRFNLRP